MGHVNSGSFGSAHAAYHISNDYFLADEVYSGSLQDTVNFGLATESGSGFRSIALEIELGTTQDLRMKKPGHPGGIVKSEIIKPSGLSVTGAAEVLGVTRAALSALLNERAHLSPEMALRLEKAFGVSMDALMRIQNSYDIAQARRRADAINVAPYKGELDDSRRKDT